MNHLPINSNSPGEQENVMRQMYLLMSKQVQSYHRQRHMGNNSSVSVALAQEMMESIAYTVSIAGGVHFQSDIEEIFLLGQAMLESRLTEAKSMLEIATATAPGWQTECRWEALQCLRQYLESYDYLHLAHKGPDGLYYPGLISIPEGIQGIDSCLFYLSILWIENQIMAAIPEDALEEFWNLLPEDALNQCEYLLINGVGKALLGRGIDSLVMKVEEKMQLFEALMNVSEDQLMEAAEHLCQWLELKNERAKYYVKAVVPRLAMWIGRTIQFETGNNLFI